MKKALGLTASLVLLLTACADVQPQPAAAKPAPAPAPATAAAAPAANPELDAVIANATDEIAKAKKVGLWRDTEKFLSDAKDARAAGKFDEALKLAKKALREAQLAQAQAAAEANAGPSYPK